MSSYDYGSYGNMDKKHDEYFDYLLQLQKESIIWMWISIAAMVVNFGVLIKILKEVSK